MLQARLDEVFTEVREELAQKSRPEVINVDSQPDVIELSDDEPSGGRPERRRRDR